MSRMMQMPIGILSTAETAPPAAGAAIGEVVLATAVAMLATAALVTLGWAHRTGRVTFLARAAERTSQVVGGPPWAALPGQVAALSLLVALFGMYWDISLHIDDGRDAGPLANPAHYFILAGLFGIFVAGFLAVVLPDERPSRAAVRIRGDWYAPVAGIVLLACSGFALLGFPLDDGWHRIFGQDVTLWGPTHLMMIGGAGLTLIGNAALLAEGGSGGARSRSGLVAVLARSRSAAVFGGLLVGLSTFQAEFDFGVPQFRLLFGPVLVAVAAGVALVGARIYTGRGGALVALAYFFVIRGLLALVVGPVLGETTPHFPLYLAEALLVEGAALAIVPRRRPYAFGALAGALIGTVGLAAEYAWSHAWMPIPWPESLIGEALVVVPLTAVAAGLIGAFVGASLIAPRSAAGVARVRPAVAAVALAFVIGVVGYGLRTDPVEDVRADVRLETIEAGPERTVAATVRVEPASAAAGADWLNVTAWQGGGLSVDELERVGPGTYRTSEPVPVYGNWKALIRMHSGDSLVTAPIFMPRDEAIPAPEVPARPTFERTFLPDPEVLQREQLEDVPPALPVIGYGIVGSIALGLIAALGWALARLARVAHEGSPPPRPAGRRRQGIGDLVPRGGAKAPTGGGASA